MWWETPLPLPHSRRLVFVLKKFSYLPNDDDVKSWKMENKKSKERRRNKYIMHLFLWRFPFPFFSGH